MATCYRHPDRETGVSCSNCGRPICTSCMTPTSVGMRCPECSRERTQVRTAASLTSDPVVTYVLIALNVAAFVGSLAAGAGVASPGGGTASRGGGSVIQDGALNGPAIADQHEYYRLVTSGFLHSGLLHIGFNMYLLWLLGPQLERVMGSWRFGVLYLTALLAGSFGALAQTSVVSVVGASGAVFGLMGATAVELRRRGLDPFSGGLGGLILLNLAIGFIPSFHVAWGGHIGGLIGGVLAALAFDQADRRRMPWLGYVGCALIAAVSVAGAISVSGNPHNYSL